MFPNTALIKVVFDCFVETEESRTMEFKNYSNLL
jgi:hypothetical protein